MRGGLRERKQGRGGCRDTRWKRLHVAFMSDCVEETESVV